MATTDSDIVNRAIALAGIVSPPVSGSPGSFTPADAKAAVAANTLYPYCVQTIARQYGYDFNRNEAVLVTSGNPPPVGWSFEYVYPANGIQVRQILPPAVADANNPSPIRWTVGYNTQSASTTSFNKVIWTNVQTASCFFTGQPPVSLWDADFAEAVARLLGSEMALAIAGKPETSKLLFESEQVFEPIAETREG